MYCKECGKEIGLNEEYCQKCKEVLETKPVQQPNTKKSSAGKKAFIIVFVIIVLLIGFGTFVYKVIIKGFLADIYNGLVNGIERAMEMKELSLHDLKIEYGFGWSEEDNESPDVKSITNGLGRVALAYKKSKMYYSTNTFAYQTMQEYQKMLDDYTVVKDITEVTINDIKWAKFEFTATIDGEKRKSLQLVYSTDYELYSILYVAREEDYKQYLDDVNKMLDTVCLSNIKESNTLDVKQQIIGEWDCGETGYLVINNDETYYFYKDSSKSMDNVIIGNYECTEGIPTNAARLCRGDIFYRVYKNIYCGWGRTTSI